MTDHSTETIRPKIENKKTFWLILAVIFSIFLGFLVRAGFEIAGFESLTSDELLYFKMLFTQIHAPQADIYFPQWRQLTDFQKWIPEALYFTFNGTIESISVGICFFNVLILFLFSLLLYHRTHRFAAMVPFLIFMVLPMPAISYWGTQICELRSYLFYAVILLWFAGKWFKNYWAAFAFGFLAAWGCWANLFTGFFVIPILWYERKELFSGSWKNRGIRAALILSGIFIASLLCYQSAPWSQWSQQGYIHYGFHSLDQLKNYVYLFFVVWPVYWFGGVPWGYLQSSNLGLYLNPAMSAWEIASAPFVFWSLWFFSLGGAWTALRKQGRLHELILYWVPGFLFALFFIFSAQSWDAITLRYLAFWQFFLPITLGLWASCLSKPFKNTRWVLVMSLWALIHGFLLTQYFVRAPHENPGHHIEAVLEKNGYTAGYANYWVADLVNYYSVGRVLLEPYNYAPLNKKALTASRDAKHIGLVWVRGLDRPEVLPEVFRQLESLGYRPSEKLDFGAEGWSILGFKKKKTETQVPNRKS